MTKVFLKSFLPYIFGFAGYFVLILPAICYKWTGWFGYGCYAQSEYKHFAIVGAEFWAIVMGLFWLAEYVWKIFKTRK